MVCKLDLIKAITKISTPLLNIIYSELFVTFYSEQSFPCLKKALPMRPFIQEGLH